MEERKMRPLFFVTEAELRNWFEKNYKKFNEVYIGFYKVDSGKKSITWSESVDQALCFGWIDGVRKSLDKESYVIRFTPRKPKSIWSAINIKKVEELLKKGLMKFEGIQAFNNRETCDAGLYSHERELAKLDLALENRFKENPKAWKFFESTPPSYKKTVLHWIMSAKQEDTRLRRLETLIQESEQERRMK